MQSQMFRIHYSGSFNPMISLSLNRIADYVCISLSTIVIILIDGNLMLCYLLYGIEIQF